MSIINYLSAVLMLFKVDGTTHLDPSTFEIQMTLEVIRCTLGDARRQARPLQVNDLKLIFDTLDLSNFEDVAFWLAIILCFRGLLRKSNVVEQDLAVKVSDVESWSWGIFLSVRRTKTIGFRERVLSIHFTSMPGSFFCIVRFFNLLLMLVCYPSSDSQLIAFMKGGVWIRGSYYWFSRKLAGISSRSSLSIPFIEEEPRLWGMLTLPYFRLRT